MLERGASRICALRGDMLCAVRFAPLDEPDTALRALELAEPRVLALLETELWPGLMSACREKDVPLAVLNGRMTSTSPNVTVCCAACFAACLPAGFWP